MSKLTDFWWSFLSKYMPFYVSVPFSLTVVLTIAFEIIRKFDAFKDELGTKKADLYGLIAIWIAFLVFIFIFKIILILKKSYLGSSVYRYKRLFKTRLLKFEQLLKNKDARIEELERNQKALEIFSKEEFKDKDRIIKKLNDQFAIRKDVENIVQTAKKYISAIREYHNSGGSGKQNAIRKGEAERVLEELRLIKEDLPQDVKQTIENVNIDNNDFNTISESEKSICRWLYRMGISI